MRPENARHEVFAQALSKGKSQAKAYAEAGYKPSVALASRLATNTIVMTRVAELQAEAAQKATDALSFEAVDLFRRFERDIAEGRW
ncbi:hypothetical protein [Mesorhizobium sp.]|uniref:hypothetical protein n=1 Tax=Mesorhizobium sp. TaxID=1871066 RepID=UPI000FEA1BB1|nr:hypothetical protein [Mesorhizobium sp.]RWO61519.1 MAG: hypothetical protein EOS14_09785 [Mesorhizobium sp.]